MHFPAKDTAPEPSPAPSPVLCRVPVGALLPCRGEPVEAQGPHPNTDCAVYARRAVALQSLVVLKRVFPRGTYVKGVHLIPKPSLQDADAPEPEARPRPEVTRDMVSVMAVVTDDGTPTPAEVPRDEAPVPDSVLVSATHTQALTAKLLITTTRRAYVYDPARPEAAPLSFLFGSDCEASECNVLFLFVKTAMGVEVCDAMHCCVTPCSRSVHHTNAPINVLLRNGGKADHWSC